MPRRFYVLYIPIQELQVQLDLMRLICDPSMMSPAHITVRGPYQKRASSSWKWKEAKDIRVKVQGLGVFFIGNQNTVFLKCVSDDLKQLWQKNDYKDFEPHITIYDGNSREFAVRLAAILDQYSLSFEFVADRLHLYERHDAKGQAKLHFYWQLYNSLFGEIAEQRLTREFLQEMTDDQRLALIDKLAQRFSSTSFQQSK